MKLNFKTEGMSVPPNIYYQFIQTNETKYQSLYKGIGRISKTIEALQEDINKKIEEHNSYNNEDENHLRYEIIDEIESDRDIASVFYCGLYLSVWSYFEKQLIVLCNIIQLDRSSKINVKDITGKPKEKFQRYLRTIANLDDILSANNQVWCELIAFHTIRNSIAHNDSIIKEEDKLILKQPSINKYFDVESKNGGKVTIKSHHTVEYFLSLADSYLIQIIYGYIFKYYPESHEWLNRMGFTVPSKKKASKK
jgi:hypothetical protein